MKKHVDFLHKKIHFIGISGAGMIALVQYLRSFGRCKLSGSDLKISKAVKELEMQGVEIFKGHDSSNINNVDIIVYSRAIPDDNCELKMAKKKRKKCFSRGEFLAILMHTYARKCVVAGTHGKTTTTGLLVHILDIAGVTPSFMIGGELPPYFINGRYSESSTFVSESDESDGSFLHLDPDVAIITNIEQEHMNFYKTQKKLLEAFEKFSMICEKNKGVLIVNKDNHHCLDLANKINAKTLCFFSLKDKKAEFNAQNIVFNMDHFTFDLYHNQKKLGALTVKLLGMHNVYNVLGCVSMCIKMGVSFEKIAEGLTRFQGVKRRMQLINTTNNIKVFDDYGHHPTEVKATLEGLRKAQKGRLTCVFQPHRYSRVQEHLIDFFDAFNRADQLLLTPIYSANEEIKDKHLLEKMRQGIQENTKNEVIVFKKQSDIVAYLADSLKDGEIVITMGAGDIFKVSHKLAKVYNEKK